MRNPFCGKRVPGLIAWSYGDDKVCFLLAGWALFGAETPECTVCVTPAGKVFGISWRGPTIPQFEAIESTGPMRAFHGQARLNSLLPSGVTQETVK